MTERPNITVSIVVPDAAQPALAEYRAGQPDLDPEILVVVDELLETGQAALHPRP